MAKDLVSSAKELGIKYFLISYTDLFGTQRAKLVPAAAIGGMVKAGASFAGFVHVGGPGSRWEDDAVVAGGCAGSEGKRGDR